LGTHTVYLKNHHTNEGIMKIQASTPPAVVRVVAVLTGLVIAGSVGMGQGKETSPAKQVVLPARVLNGLKAKFPSAVIAKQTMEKEDGKEVYDIEFTQARVKHEADLSADGTILNWEKAVPAKELPAAVTRAIGKKYPKAVIREVMAVTEVKGGKEALEGYEVTLRTADKKEQEIMISPDGKILEESGDEE
jgi:uncharacterized membrane protein YkoI